MTHQKIAVIAGAGPAGLTAAYELLKRTDIKPVVFEASNMIGGIAQTFNYKGNRIDIGGHRFFSKEKRVMDWWFNILPLQGAPSADTAEKKHDIDYASEWASEFLCAKCVPEWIQKDGEKTGENTYKFPAPDPEKEDQVMLQRPRLSRIFYRRNFFPYPIGITLAVAKRLGFWNTFLIGMSYIWRHTFPLKDETYLDAFYRNRFGDRLYKTFFEAYTEKVWGVPVGQIRADWGAQRVKGLSLKRAVAHAIKDLLSSDFKKAQQERETSLITRFYYPKFGPGQMWETVAGQVQSCGGEVHMERRIIGVHVDPSDGSHSTSSGQAGQGRKVHSVTIEDIKTGKREEMKCDYFFSTMPIKHLCGMMTPDVPSDVREVADGLHYRDFLTVGLLLKKLHVQRKRQIDREVPDNWIYIQEGDVRVGRVQVFNNWSPYMVANRKDHIWIGLEYFVNEGGDLWVKPDQEMIDFGIAEMEKIAFLKKEDVVDACVLRMPKAYPAYIGSYTQLGTVEKFVNTIPNLFLIGRNGMHRYNNQDHSMLTAMMAVDNIMAGQEDKTNLWNVNLDMVYHEEKKTH
jgi:protoporphyrinogen oxidase